MPDEGLRSTTLCPYCAEPVLIDAKKCKHCKEFIDPAIHNRAVNMLWRESKSPTDAPAFAPKWRKKALLVSAGVIGAIFAFGIASSTYHAFAGNHKLPSNPPQGNKAPPSTIPLAAAALPTYRNFRDEVDGKKWMINSVPCGTDGGSYEIFTSANGDTFVAGGKEIAPQTRATHRFSKLTHDGFQLTVQYLANDLVASKLGDSNAVSSQVVWTVRRSSDGGIDYHKDIKQLNLEQLLNGIRQYDEQEEDGHATTCQQQGRASNANGVALSQPNGNPSFENAHLAMDQSGPACDDLKREVKRISKGYYFPARRNLISAGWMPISHDPSGPDYEINPMVQDLWKSGYKEIQSCSQGAVFCQFTFKDKYNNFLRVVTGGEFDGMPQGSPVDNVQLTCFRK